jgi:hypothetical protein
MPEFGMLAGSDVDAPVADGQHPAPWELKEARVAQITFEVAKASALAYLPPDLSRPLPAYGRLIVVAAPDSPAGPVTIAALCVSGRYAMTPRNVAVQLVVDGPAAVVAGTFGGPVVDGSVHLDVDDSGVAGEVITGGSPAARFRFPTPHPVDPAMLRWDQWVTYRAAGDGVELIGFALEVASSSAALSKGATIDTDAGRGRADVWRRLASRKVISACSVQGTVTLGEVSTHQALSA